MYVGFEQITVSTAVLDVTHLDPPVEATHVEIQCTVESNPTRYTMLPSSPPSTTVGMLFNAGAEPKLFLIEDLKRIQFVRDGAADSELAFHYSAGRMI